MTRDNSAEARAPIHDDTLRQAIKVTEYKYFGDYEMSDVQRGAVNALVEFARHYLEAEQNTADRQSGSDEADTVTRSRELLAEEVGAAEAKMIRNGNGCLVYSLQALSAIRNALGAEQNTGLRLAAVSEASGGMPGREGLLIDACGIIDHYAAFIRNVKADDIEQHPYLPLVEQTATDLRQAILSLAATGGTGAEGYIAELEAALLPFAEACDLFGPGQHGRVDPADLRRASDIAKRVR